MRIKRLNEMAKVDKLTEYGYFIEDRLKFKEMNSYIDFEYIDNLEDFKLGDVQYRFGFSDLSFDALQTIMDNIKKGDFSNFFSITSGNVDSDELKSGTIIISFEATAEEIEEHWFNMTEWRKRQNLRDLNI